MMKAIILAAGKGERMEPLTLTRPKPLMPIAGKPFMQHIVEQIREAGIEEIILVTNENEGTIKDYFKQDKGISFAHQEKQLGTAHAISMAKGMADSALVLNGDNLPIASDLKKLIAFHKSQRSICTLSVRKEKDVSHLSSVEFDAKGRIQKITEKPKAPKSDYASLGVYIFEKEALTEMEKVKKSDRGEYEIPDAVQNLITRNRPVYACELTYWEHITYPHDLLEANERMLEEMEPEVLGTVEKGATLIGKVNVGEGTLVRAGSYIVGPVTIGKDCTIGPNCFIRPATAIGDGCHIGQAVEIKNSIVFDHTNINHLSYVGDSIIGSHVNIGAGTICANLRFDNRTVAYTVKGKPVDTGRRKLGAIIADNCQTGIHSVINPGKRIYPNSCIGPGTVVTEDVPADTIYYSEQTICRKKAAEK